MSLEDTRDELLEAMLPHVPFTGWSGQSLDAAAEDLGLSADEALLAFPGGERELAAHYFDWTDRRMIEALDPRQLIRMKVRERVAAVVRTRLEQKAGHKEAVRRLTAFLALPPNAPLGARCTWHSVSEIWYAAGDNATDWNWYSKRGLLLAVYTSTFLFWLNDSSEDHEYTWEFLDRRIDDVMRIQGVRSNLDRVVGEMPRALRALGRFVRSAR